MAINFDGTDDFVDIEELGERLAVRLVAWWIPDPNGTLPFVNVMETDEEE